MKQSTAIAALLERDATLQPLVAQAERLLALQRMFVEVAPAELAHAARVANLRRGVVIVHAAHNATAAKLKMLLPNLTRAFQQCCTDVKSVQIEVQFSPAATSGIRQTSKTALSAAAARRCDELAAKLPESQLRDVMKSLARRTRD